MGAGRKHRKVEKGHTKAKISPYQHQKKKKAKRKRKKIKAKKKKALLVQVRGTAALKKTEQPSQAQLFQTIKGENILGEERRGDAHTRAQRQLPALRSLTVTPFCSSQRSVTNTHPASTRSHGKSQQHRAGSAAHRLFASRELGLRSL